MAIGPQHHPSHLPQQLTEERRPSQITAQNQQIDKKADQPFAFYTGAIRDIGAHHHIWLSTPMSQHHLEASQQRHKQRHRMPLTHLLQPIADLLRQREEVARTSVALLLATWGISGHL